MIDRPPLSLALAAFRSSGGTDHPRAAIEAAAAAGFRWVTLDGAAPGMRARELDRSARRDLGALLRRLELGFLGLDLWIPASHLTDPAQADRALAALLDAIGLAADLAALAGGKAVVGLALPPTIAPGARDSLLSHADARGVRIADHAWPPADARDSETLGVGFDPAAVLLAGDNPAKAVARLGPRVVTARLSDASDTGRVEPGRGIGRLNDLAYAVALLAAKHADPVVLDLRGVPDPSGAVARVAGWWSGA